MPAKRPTPDTSDANLTLRTLGNASLLSLSEGAEPAEVFGVGKPLALITYLAATPAGHASRARLIDLLWSDLDPDAAKHALRQTIWYIRRRGGAQLLAATSDAVALGFNLPSDRTELLAASAAGQHERVVALYRGPFFPDFAAPGCLEFEHWADAERRRLAQIFASSCDDLVRRLLNEAKFREAQALARRLRDSVPHSEAAWRLVLEAHLSAGDQLGAVLDADALENMAAHEELELEASTRALIRTVRSGRRRLTEPASTPDEPDSSSLETVLVGREAAFSRVLSAWDAVQRGRSWRFVIVARSGLGKTRLIRDLAVRLRASRARVVTARASLTQRDLVYALASEVAAALAALPGARAISTQSAAILVGLNPTLSTHFSAPPRSVTGDEGLRQLVLALRELIDAVADEHAVALFIDDLHWSDDASHRLLMNVASELVTPRLLLVFSSRPDGRLAQHHGGAFEDLIDLPALEPKHVAQMIESVAALPDDSWARELPVQLCRSADGSPLLVLETLQHLMDRGVLTRIDDVWHYARPGELSTILTSGSPIRTRLAALDRPERWLLTVAACVRRPLSLDFFARADDRSTDTVRRALIELERRGLLRREGDRWQITHDEIADAALDVVGDEARRAALVATGRALTATSGFPDRDGQLAAQMLTSAQATDELRSLFGRIAARAYARGDRRRPSLLAADLLGVGADDAVAQTLAASVPLRWRLGLVSRARAVSAAAVAIGVAALLTTMALWRAGASPPPDAVLAALAPEAGTLLVRQFELREDDWPDSKPLSDRTTTTDFVVPGFDLTSVGGTASPTGRGVILSLAVDDSGVIDLFRAEPGQPLRRLTWSRGDDLTPDLSPDGHSLVFSTARWSEFSRYDLALLDVQTGQVSQLTSGDESDDGPRWSLDATSVAFTRRRWGRGSTQLCVLHLSGRQLSCRDTPLVSQFSGWLDATHALVRTDSSGRRRLNVVNVQTGELRPFDMDWQVDMATVSPDGRWVFCRCAVRQGDPVVPVVFPSDRPRRFRTVQTTPATASMFPTWLTYSRAALSNSVAIDSGWRSVIVGAPHTFTAVVQDSLGRAMTSSAVRWSVIGREASIDSATGVLVTPRAGPLEVVATADARIRARIRVTAVSDSNALLWTEDWTDSSLARWYHIGWPSSRVADRPGASHALFTNGDGSYHSGVVSRARFETSQGLAIDMDVSTPATLSQWQLLELFLRNIRDTVTYEMAAGHNAPPYPNPADVVCDAGWPVESAVATGEARTLTLNNGNGGANVPIQSRHVSGRWLHFRLQLFPDGRCGVAFDGQPLAVTQGPGPWHPYVHLEIGGNSYRTRILVGPVRIRRGVPNDIDWAPLLLH